MTSDRDELLQLYEYKARQDLKRFKKTTRAKSEVYSSFLELPNVVDSILKYLKEYEKHMDKKMRLVTKAIETAERDVKGKKPSKALDALKGAAKKNEKLTAIDKNVRDPLIAKCKAEMKGGKHGKGK